VKRRPAPENVQPDAFPSRQTEGGKTFSNRENGRRKDPSGRKEDEKNPLPLEGAGGGGVEIPKALWVPLGLKPAMASLEELFEAEEAISPNIR
jgi:hypothetical protein